MRVSNNLRLAWLDAAYFQDIEHNATKCFLVGWLLSNLYDDREHLLEAKKYYDKAAALGHLQAGFNAGLMITENVLPDLDKKEGMAYIEQAAKSGYGKAYTSLALYHEKGQLTEKDLPQAELLYKKAIEHGHDLAACNLAYLYLFNPEYRAALPDKLPLIIRHLTAGEYRQHVGSIYILGRVYHMGLLQEESDQDGLTRQQKAIEYYQKGVSLKHQPSIRALKQTYTELLQANPKSEQQAYWRTSIETLNNILCSITSTQTTDLQRYRHCQAQISIANYEFYDSWHFISAITRPGFKETADLPNCFRAKLTRGEHLEWLGDATLCTAIRRSLIAYYPKNDTGTLTEYYKKYVNNADESAPHGGPLYRIAKHLKLQPLILMPQNDSLTLFPRRGRHKKKHTVEMQLSNHLEMLIGAIAQDSDTATAEAFLKEPLQALGLNPALAADEDYGFSDTDTFDSRVH